MAATWKHPTLGTFTFEAMGWTKIVDVPAFKAFSYDTGYDDAHFKEIANGMPGLELRMPLMFSEGVQKGRIALERLVELCCTNPARIYGLHPKKGTIAIGADADLAVWDPERKVEVTDQLTHDAVDYCPYAGMVLQGWPVTVFSRGEVIVEEGELVAEPGRGRFLPRAAGAAAKPLGRLAPEIDPSCNFGAELLD